MLLVPPALLPPSLPHITAVTLHVAPPTTPSLTLPHHFPHTHEATTTYTYLLRHPSTCDRTKGVLAIETNV